MTDAQQPSRRRLFSGRVWALIGLSVATVLGAQGTAACLTTSRVTYSLKDNPTPQVHWDGGLIAWGIACAIATLALAAGLVLTAQRRLKPGAGIPVVSLVLLVGCAWVAAIGFDAPTF